MSESIIFDGFTINQVRFENRILRSSVGGRTGNYDGTVTDVWKNFERRFAEGGVGGIISTTFHVNSDRLSPPQYPSIADPKYVPYLKKYIAQIKEGLATKYILQIGDPGYAAYSSLFPERQDGKSSSGGFDLIYGYTNRRYRMSNAEIEKSIRDFGDAAERAREAGADGIEVTLAKGYLIHQFLCPVINRRKDKWGGNVEKRFYYAKRVLQEVRSRVGKDFLVGVRLSAQDFTGRMNLTLLHLPWGRGNGVRQMLEYAKQLQGLVDYLHIVSGYGFPNPSDVPGKFPYEEAKRFFNTYRDLSGKARLRAGIINLIPRGIGSWLMNIGWECKEGINRPFSKQFKAQIDLPVIVNGGFQDRKDIEDAISSKDCDMVSMARALIATPDLLEQFRREPARRLPDVCCTRCNKCVGRTATSPLGCYDVSRFGNSKRAMHEQILEWNRPDP